MGVTGRYLITGASGWFGKTALFEFERIHGPESLRRDVIAFSSRDCLIDIGSSHGPIQAYGLENIHEIENPTGLLHLAFVTRDKITRYGLEEYVAINRAITDRIGKVLLRFPHLPVITTSSGAAAAMDGRTPDIHSDPYATLKQEEEAVLARDPTERMAIVFRVYAASGCFMVNPEQFALGDFIVKALQGKPIRIVSRHPVWRSYVHAGDLMSLCWNLLAVPLTEGYRLIDACSHTAEIGHIANEVVRYLGNGRIERELSSGLNPEFYAGDRRGLSAISEARSITMRDLQEQIIDTADGVGCNPGSCAGRTVRH